MKVCVRSNSKINVGLNIEGILENGYHSLDMIMVPISLSDYLHIEFKEKKGNLKILSNNPLVPTGEKNILSKIYKRFYEITKYEKESIEVYLDKQIPSQAGLGGGSSNGAFFLKELNKFHGNILSEKEMIEVSVKIGADIPFFIVNKPCRARGIGDEIENFENKLKSKIIIIKPSFGISTPVAFKNFDLLQNKNNLKKAEIEKIIKGISENDLYLIIRGIENQLEGSLLIIEQNIIEFRKRLDEFSELKFFMSGSGSAYYCFVEEEASKNKLVQLKNYFKNCDVYLCEFL
ncbi:MAG: 4-(cytidine 5'-diphospho)-2-C-methyl-D-erythritol kinase [Fusobacteriaceae bacterium]